MSEISKSNAQPRARYDHTTIMRQIGGQGRRDTMKTVGDSAWRALTDALGEPSLKKQPMIQGVPTRSGFLLIRDSTNWGVKVAWVPMGADADQFTDEEYYADIRKHLDRWTSDFTLRGWRCEERTDSEGLPYIWLPLDAPSRS